MYRMGSSQRLPRIMHAWERMRNFIILKEYACLRVKNYCLYGIQWRIRHFRGYSLAIKI